MVKKTGGPKILGCEWCDRVVWRHLSWATAETAKSRTEVPRAVLSALQSECQDPIFTFTNPGSNTGCNESPKDSLPDQRPYVKGPTTTPKRPELLDFDRGARVDKLLL